MGCLFLILVGISPRLGVIGIWLLTDWVDRAFNGGWILPLAGLILLPWTTALYVVGYVIGDGAAPWGVLGVFIGLFLDVAVHAGSATMGRRRYAST
jgi:hypothetical protein